MKKRKNARTWREEENEVLRQYYRDKGTKFCVSLLPKRTESAIKARANDLKIKRNPNRELIKVDEILILDEYQKIRDKKELSKILGIGISLINRTLKKHNVKKLRKMRAHRIKDELIADYMANKLNGDQLVRKYDISKTNMSVALRSWGIKNPQRQAIFSQDINVRRGGKTTYQLWVDKYGVEEADRLSVELKTRQSKNSSGKNNPMYGKPSPQGAGNGWKGWYKGHYFRSLREVQWMIEADERGLKWEQAEKKIYTIEYKLDGVQRTYRPDFFADNVLYELKPIRLHKSPSVMAKTNAANEFCVKHGFTYVLTDIEIKPNIIASTLNAGHIRFDRDYEEKFKEYLAKISSSDV